jgi:DNA-directed RNA polymerase alpha subunit
MVLFQVTAVQNDNNGTLDLDEVWRRFVEQLYQIEGVEFVERIEGVDVRDRIDPESSIEVLGMPTLITTSLYKAEIFLVVDLIQLTAMQLLALPCVGRKTLKAVEFALGQRGLRLGMKVVMPPRSRDQKSIMERSIDSLRISEMCVAGLHESKVYSISDLVRMTEVDLLKTKNCGRRCIVEIKIALRRLGLRIGQGVTQ